jgi:hypothetical protein
MSNNQGSNANTGSPTVYEILNADGFSTTDKSLMSHIKNGVRFYQPLFGSNYSTNNTNNEKHTIRLYDRDNNNKSETISISKEDLTKLISKNVSTELSLSNAKKFLEKGFNNAPTPMAAPMAPSQGASGSSLGATPSFGYTTGLNSFGSAHHNATAAEPQGALAPAPAPQGAAFTLSLYNQGYTGAVPNKVNKGAVPNTEGGRRYRKHSHKRKTAKRSSHKRKTAKRSSHKRKSTRRH